MNFEKLNPYFKQLEVDYLYHLGIDSSMDLSIFDDLEYVVFTRSDADSLLFANIYAKENNIYEFKAHPVFKTERYHMYKVGPVFVVSHGIGAPSLLIALNEVAKLMYHVNKPNIKFLKINPAGGIGGITIGDINLVETSLNGKLEPLFHTIECGVNYAYSTSLSNSLLLDIKNYCDKNNYKIFIGNAIGAADFYEEQARIDGFLPLNTTKEDRDLYMQRVISMNVKTINMEATVFASFCNELTIDACALDVVVVDRTNTDVVPMSDNDKPVVMSHAFSLVSKYIANQ